MPTTERRSFRHLKEAWRSILTKYKLTQPSCKIVPKSEFARLVRIALDKMDSVKVPNSEEMSSVQGITVKGFEATRIFL